MAPPEPTRIVIIVGRDRADLHDYFRQGFAGLETVEVVVDRRAAETPGDESEAARNRRWQRDVSEELALRGFVIARLP